MDDCIEDIEEWKQKKIPHNVIEIRVIIKMYDYLVVFYIFKNNTFLKTLLINQFLINSIDVTIIWL